MIKVDVRYVAYLRYDVDSLSGVRNWLLKLSPEGTLWHFDWWTSPFEEYCIQFVNPRHLALFELRFAGELGFISTGTEAF